MAEPREIEVPVRSIRRLARMLGSIRSVELEHAAEATRREMGARRIWNINSTSQGGGVAEMLQHLVGYANDAGVDTRWVVIAGDPEFFFITKRLHNRLHGEKGDDGDLGWREAEHYRAVLQDNADALDERIEPEDIVILHDPQTAGLAGHLARRGVRVVWRCHIGTGRANLSTREAWDFLLPFLVGTHAFVFSHASFVPRQLATSDVWIILPSIDPLSPKNRPLAPARRSAILSRIGLLSDDGVTTSSALLGGATPLAPTDRVVVQVSRWDHLKDMLGVLNGFAEHVACRSDARLALVGPAVDGVTDDPEEFKVLNECLHAWDALPTRIRDTVRLVALPTDDVSANALMVNAIQRHASVVVQKSIQEGFGLTVTEAMWKSRPVVASAVGGIVDQVALGTGILLEDPHDLDAFGRALLDLLGQPSQMASLGRRARQRVREHYLSDRHLIGYGRLLQHVTQI